MLCSFCIATFFSDDDWDGNSRGHHINAASWVSSILKECFLCVTLWQGLEDTIVIRSPDLLREISKDPSSKDHGIVSREGRIEAALKSAVISWPFYSAACFNKVGGKWTLVFEPGQIVLDSTQLELDELVRRFTIFPLDHNHDTSDARQLSDHTGDGHSFLRVKAWIDACDNHHDHCRPVETPKSGKNLWLPTRLLSIGTCQSHGVKLIDGDENKVRGRFMTLSHCWGRDFRPIQLNKDTKKDYYESIPWDGEAGLPQTFRDAIEVTRALGIRYIWIDSLCIVQGDKAEWLREGPRLEHVYRHSYCNLAAVDSVDGRGGLFRQRNPEAVALTTVAADSLLFPRGRYGIVRPDLWAGEVLSEPLYRRAWVFQADFRHERMLSPRMLHFTKHQIFWQCSTMTVSETATNAFPREVEDDPEEELAWRRALHQNRLTEESSLQQRYKLDLDRIWTTCVHSFTSCALTFNKDKLLAIAGIASVLKRAFEDEYLAGLWKPSASGIGVNAHLAEQLGWYVQDSKKADGSPSIRYGRDGHPPPAPTWSWASVDGVIRLRERSRLPRAYLAEVLETKVALEEEGLEVGPVHPEDCFIKLKGQMLRLKFWKPSYLENEWQWLPPQDRSNEAKEPFCLAQFDEERGVEYATEGIVVLVFLLAYSSHVRPTEENSYSGHGLVLKARDKEKGHYERVGSIDFKTLTPEDWEQMQSEAIEPDGGVSTIVLK